MKSSHSRRLLLYGAVRRSEVEEEGKEGKEEKWENVAYRKDAIQRGGGGEKKWRMGRIRRRCSVPKRGDMKEEEEEEGERVENEKNASNSGKVKDEGKGEIMGDREERVFLKL